MHRSVLQNKKYIKFAEENTVEVIAIGGAEQAVSAGHEKAATYKAKDAQGNEVDYMVEFPGMTAKQLDELASSGASKYRGEGIPFTAIVNPHTLGQMTSMLGGQAAGTLMDAVLEQRKSLQKEYGKGVKRKDLEKVLRQEAAIRGDAEAGRLDRALAAARKLEGECAKKGDALQQKSKTVLDAVLEACGKRLDEIDAALGRGEAAAAKDLHPLARALKGTALEERANELLARAAPPAEPG